MSKLREIRQKKVAILKEIREVLLKLEDDTLETEARDAVKAQLAGLNARKDEYSKLESEYEAIETEERALGATTSEVKITVTRNENEDESGAYRGFKNLGEQLIAVRNSSMPGATVDARLLDLSKRAASGLSEGIGTDGGFLVQGDFSSELIKAASDAGVLTSRVRKFPITGNSLTMNGINETSRADGSRWGGVQAYWENEADEATASKPKFRELKFKLNKLIGLCYATDELMADAPALGSVIQSAFSEEFAYKLDDAIFNGNGAGKPMGILNAPALISITKESGQAAATIKAANIIKMHARLWARSRANSVWLINQDCEPQLHQLFISGSNSDIPMYLPANGLAGQQYNTLYGRPVFAIEQAKTLGTVGDIVLADMSQYGWIQKGGLESATSIHVKFTTDQTAFRFIVRVDGQPLWHSAMTPANGTNTLSPFVALETRS